MIIVVDDPDIVCAAGVESTRPSQIIGLAYIPTRCTTTVTTYVVRRPAPDGLFVPPVVQIIRRPHFKADSTVVTVH